MDATKYEREQSKATERGENKKPLQFTSGVWFNYRFNGEEPLVGAMLYYITIIRVNLCPQPKYFDFALFFGRIIPGKGRGR